MTGLLPLGGSGTATPPPPTAATPTFSPGAGSYSVAQSVTLACSTAGSSIYYTTDGSTPTYPITGSTQLYTGALSVAATQTINAIGVASGYVNSAVGTATYTITVAANTNGFKFTPGYFYGTYANTAGAGLPATGPSTQLATDLAQLAAFPLPSNQTPAYAFPMRWSNLEPFPGPSTNSNNSSQYSITALAAVINQCQAAFPSTGCRLCIYLSYEEIANITDATIRSRNWTTSGGGIVPVWVALANGTPSSFSVPTEFGQSSPVTTGVAAPIYSGASYYNILFANWNGSTEYVIACPDWRSLQVQQAIIQMLQWLSQAEFTITTGPFAGTWTLNSCPCIEFISNNDEISNSFNQGPDQPQTPSGAASATWQNLLAGYVNVMNATQALFPNTRCATCTTYGITGQNGSQSAGYDMGALVNPNISFSSAGVPRYTPTIFLSGSDTYASDWGSTISEANPAKLGHTGRVSPSNFVEGQPLISPTVASQVGVGGYLGQIQPDDWDTDAKHIPSGVTIHTASMVIALLQAANVAGATDLVICNGDGTTFDNNAWSGDGSSSYIQAALIANYATYPLTPLLPYNLMYGPAITSVVPTSATQVVVTWAALPLAGFGGTGPSMTVQLCRDGSAISGAVGSAQSFTTYTDTVVAGATHGYSLEMINSNGTGPQGPVWEYTAPDFWFNSFSSADASVINGVSDAFAWSGSAMQVCIGTGHFAGAAWYKTQYNISEFTCNFTFQIPGPVSTVPTTAGLSFMVQNSNVTTDPNYDGGVRWGTFAAGDANLDGLGCYSNQFDTTPAIGNAVAIKFDLNPNNFTGDLTYIPGTNTPNQTGCYTNGGAYGALVASNDLNSNGINLYSGHVFAVNVVYDGTLLTMVIKDTTTGAQGRYVWPVDIPLYIDMTASTTTDLAWIGFTGGTVGSSSPALNILSWNFTSAYAPRLATPTFSVAPGEYGSTQSVTINGPAGANLYYTTSGSFPTSASTLVTGPISVSSNKIIKVVAIAPGYTDSLVAVGQYQIGTSNLINLGSGFSSGDGMCLNGYAYRSGSAIQLTDVTGVSPGNNPGDFEVSSAWFGALMPITAFHLDFTLEQSNSNSNGTYGLGCTVCIQNKPSSTQNPDQLGYISGGETALGADNSALGYGPPTSSLTSGTNGGIQASIAIKFDLSNNSTGLYQNGAIPTGTGEVAITGITLDSGHPITVALTYSGTTLSMLMTDTVTTTTFSHNWTGVNLASIIGQNYGYIGFTASSGYWCAIQKILALSYTSP